MTATLPLSDFFISRITISPDGARAYVTNTGNDRAVKVLDTASDTVVGRDRRRRRPFAIAV